MGLEHKVKTTNLLDDIEEELFKSLKIKISFDKDNEDNKDNKDNKDNEKTTKE